MNDFFSKISEFVGIALIILASGFVLWIALPYISNESEKFKKTIAQTYEDGFRDGWRNNTDMELCMLGGKFAVESLEIPFYRDCIPLEDKEGHSGSYLTDEGPE